MASALSVAAGDVFLLLLLYAHSTCITWMASDNIMMSKTASITTRTQAVVSLGLIWLLLDDRVLPQGSSSSASVIRDQMTQLKYYAA